jgi:hypothetical protein
VGPSAPSAASSSVTPPCAPARVSPTKRTTEKGDPPPSHLVFAEFFAGCGELTRTMQGRGVECRFADDLASGGTDFEDATQVAQVKQELRDLRTQGAALALLFAPPCFTLSRARDRSHATQLRSTSHPEGLPGLDADQSKLVKSANAIVLLVFELAMYAARELSAVVIIENPATSYIWALVARLRPGFKVTWRDIKVSQCLFGTPYRKDWPSPVERRIRP